MTNPELQHRPWGKPQLDFTPTVDPCSRTIVAHEYSNWSTLLKTPEQILRAVGLPEGFRFTQEDRRIGWLNSREIFSAISENIPVHCADFFIARQNKEGEREVFTAIRIQWPLDGFRFIVGGRNPRPPSDHPLATKWSRDVGALLVLFRETGLQPNSIEALAPLMTVDFNFHRSLDGSTSPSRREVKFTPSDTYVVLLRGEAPDFSVTPISGLKDPVWISNRSLNFHPVVEATLSDYVRLGLSLVLQRPFRQNTAEGAAETFFRTATDGGSGIVTQ